MNILEKKYYLFLALLIISCQNETNFFVLKNIGSNIEKSIREREISEYIIISNLPKEHDSLVNLITKYNDTTVKYCDYIENEKLQYYRRFFYKESYKLNRDYKEKEDFISDHIGHYNQDIIAVLRYSSKGDWNFKVKLSDSEKWKHYPIKEIKCN